MMKRLITKMSTPATQVIKCASRAYRGASKATKPETRYTRARPIDPDPMIDKVWLLLDYYCRSKIELQICHSCSLGTADTCPALALTANVFQCHVPGLATPELRVRHIS